MKACSRCKVSRRLEAFAKHKNSPGGLQAWCRACVASYHKEYRKRGYALEASRAHCENFRQTIRGRSLNLLNNARHVSRARRLIFSLTREWVEKKLVAGACEVTGIRFALKPPDKGHRTNSFSPSIDRIDQRGDYTQENCRLVAWIYNRARGAFPDEDFDLMLEALESRKRPLIRKVIA